MTASPNHRWRRLLGWSARWPLGVLAALCILLWAVSLWWVLRWHSTTDALQLAPGCIDWFNFRTPVGHFSEAAFVTQPLGKPGTTIIQRLDTLGWLPRWHFPGTPPRGPVPYFVRIPLWMLVVLCATPGAWAWWRHLRQRTATGCTNCGYDLSGLPRSSPCPECGNPRNA